MKEIHVKVSEELKKELQEEAEKLEIPLATYIRLIITKRNE